jgi:hypothetical protein
MGESFSTASQPRKLCSWILFPLRPQVKQKSEPPVFGGKLLFQADLREIGLRSSYARIAKKGAFQAEDFGLIHRKCRIY